MRATTFLWTSFQLEVYTQSYGPPKSRESQFWEFWDSHLGVSKQSDIWVLVPWPGTKHTIRRKVVASLKSRPWWVLWVRVCPWLVCAPKCSNYALTNLLFGLCKSKWVIELLINLSSPFQSSNTPFYPQSVASQGVCPNSFSSYCFTFGLEVYSVKELGGASFKHHYNHNTNITKY
jgi:hypothetical protein